MRPQRKRAWSDRLHEILTRSRQRVESVAQQANFMLAGGRDGKSSAGSPQPDAGGRRRTQPDDCAATQSPRPGDFEKFLTGTTSSTQHSTPRPTSRNMDNWCEEPTSGPYRHRSETRKPEGVTFEKERNGNELEDLEHTVREKRPSKNGETSKRSRRKGRTQ